MAIDGALQPSFDLLDRTRGANLDQLRTSFGWAFDGRLPDVFLDCKYLGTPMAAWLIRTGGVWVRFGRHTTSARPGQWIFPAAVDGWQRFSPGSTLLSVRFTARWLDRSSLFDHSTPTVIDASACPELESEGAALVRAVRTHVGDVHESLWSKPATLDAHFAIQERFQGWMAAYLRAMRRAGRKPRIMDERDERLIAALRFLEDHPLSKPVRESDVASATGLSISQLNRLFASQYDTTPKRHFDARRFEFASNTLRFTDMQVKTIAYKLGFNSLPHFTKWFHRKAGMNPTTYRENGQR